MRRFIWRRSRRSGWLHGRGVYFGTLHLGSLSITNIYLGLRVYSLRKCLEWNVYPQRGITTNGDDNGIYVLSSANKVSVRLLSSQRWLFTSLTRYRWNYWVVSADCSVVQPIACKPAIVCKREHVGDMALVQYVRREEHKNEGHCASKCPPGCSQCTFFPLATIIYIL